ncbi:MAG: hypothetical protein WCX31_05195 [Salinivirgaceae bacterium]|jgi:hypothetical protein
MKNLRNWILAITAILLVGTFSCSSSVNKQVKEEPVEMIETFDEDTSSYIEDTTLIDDEGILEDTTEEEAE